MRSVLRWALGLLVLAAACDQVGIEIVTPTAPVATALTQPPSTDPPTDTSPTETTEPSPTPDATPNADAPPVEGLVYSAPDGIYWVDMTGLPHKIFDRPDAAISLDVTQALYAEGDDIWLVTLGTGTPVNLTNTPDRIEHSPRWWPARPDLVVFGSYPVGRELAFGPALFPSVIGIDGSDYRVIDAETDAFTIALSPDGHTLAYGVGPVGYLYDLDSQQRVAFDPQDYGVSLQGNLPNPTDWSVAGPAYSNDGSHMSWTLGQFFADGTNQYTLLMVDMAAHTSTFMHVYHVPPSDYVPGPGVWSPDGQWVAYFAAADEPSEIGMWVARMDGSEERYLGAGNGPVWRDDGGWLAYSANGGVTFLYRTDLGTVTRFSGPANSIVIGW